MAAAALVAVVVAPASASALLTNEYGQHFAGTAVCVDCHTNVYDETTHGEFSVPEALPTPSETQGAGMWPAGRIDAGETLQAEDVGFTLGAGTGIREYIAKASLLGGVDFTPAGNSPFAMVEGLEWDPDEPTDFEYALDDYNPARNGIEYADYTCSQCHQLGVVRRNVKPVAGNFTSTTGTVNTWAIPEGADPASFDSYIPGASIQCERCHGTGLDATADNGGHWNSGVKIVGFNTPAMYPLARAASQKILDSQVCGQCHGSFKSGGNIVGFTPDQTITAFVPNQYSATDVPTEASFTANPGAYKFFPNGENKSLKHVYYTEWAMSAHSWRGALTSASPNATPYQKLGTGHFSRNTSILCNRCHTGEGYLKRKLGVDAPLGNIMAQFTEATANEGYLGQECATCHISHGADSDEPNAVGMAVRAPEKANGQFSTLGLNVDNKSICEDCHNWQREVASAGAAPALPSILGKYVSHPQREIYHGRAMLEIPAASDFMPGAKCEQCHMPATRSDFPESTGLPRYDNRSFKRYSHRMFIMEPGDAKAWGLAPWGDSCSPCHAGETQDQLQANIDNWQDTAADLAADVTTEINAAVTRGDNVAAGDVDLLKRASANLSLFVQDSSEGAHNPPYEQAGLAKAAELASFAGGHLDVMAPTSVGSNSLFAIAGDVEIGNDSPAAGVTVTLWSGSTKLGTSVTDDEGNFAFAYAMTADKTFTVKWQRSSQSVSDVTESFTVEVEKIPTTLSIARNVSSILAGRSFRLSGELNPDGAAPASVQIQYKKPGTSTWRTLRTVTTSADGSYTTTYSTRTKGTWSFRAFYAGDTTYKSDYSSIVKVLVK